MYRTLQKRDVQDYSGEENFCQIFFISSNIIFFCLVARSFLLHSSCDFSIQSSWILNIVQSFESFHGAMFFGVLLVSSNSWRLKIINKHLEKISWNFNILKLFTLVLLTINFTSHGENYIGSHSSSSNHGKDNASLKFIQLYGEKN